MYVLKNVIQGEAVASVAPLKLSTVSQWRLYGGVWVHPPPQTKTLVRYLYYIIICLSFILDDYFFFKYALFSDVFAGEGWKSL